MSPGDFRNTIYQSKGFVGMKNTAKDKGKGCHGTECQCLSVVQTFSSARARVL